MKKLLIFSSLMLFVFSGWSKGIKQDTKIEERFDQTFFVNENDVVDISNKYGEVIVNTWLSDSVRIKVQVTAEGKTRETVSKLMGRVDVKLRKIGDMIQGRTEVDKASGVFGEVLSQVEDYSKTFLKTNKITVDYEIWIPAEIDLVISNRFGNLYLSSLSGDVDITLAYGDIRGNDIENSLSLTHSFGKSTFDYIKEGDMVLRATETKIASSEKLVFESSSSKIFIENVENIRMNSRNDEFQIEKSGSIVCEGTFTDLRLDYAMANVTLDFSYGDIFLTRIQKDFESIDIKGKSTDINLILDQASYIKTKITGPEDKMILPNSMLVMNKQLLEENYISLSGFVGNTNTTFGQLNIDAESGELIISIKETPIYTDRD